MPREKFTLKQHRAAGRHLRKTFFQRQLPKETAAVKSMFKAINARLDKIRNQ